MDESKKEAAENTAKIIMSNAYGAWEQIDDGYIEMKRPSGQTVRIYVQRNPMTKRCETCGMEIDGWPADETHKDAPTFEEIQEGNWTAYGTKNNPLENLH